MLNVSFRCDNNELIYTDRCSTIKWKMRGDFSALLEAINNGTSHVSKTHPIISYDYGFVDLAAHKAELQIYVRFELESALGHQLIGALKAQAGLELAPI